MTKPNYEVLCVATTERTNPMPEIYTNITDIQDLSEQVDSFIASVKRDGYTHHNHTDEDALRALYLLEQSRKYYGALKIIMMAVDNDRTLLKAYRLRDAQVADTLRMLSRQNADPQTMSDIGYLDMLADRLESEISPQQAADMLFATPEDHK